VQIHINPNHTDKAATGKFHNDDGKVFDNTNKWNSYEFIFTILEADSKLEIEIIHNAVATDYSNNRVNSNDQASVFRIYNALALSINVAYSVVATGVDDST
jgi:hypothetical protein